MSKRERLLSEPDAWREIARRIATRGLRGVGLCFEVGSAWCYFALPDEPVIIDRETKDAMHDRIDRHLNGDMVIVNSSLGYREVTDIRILAALFLALEAEDELTGQPWRVPEAS